MKTVGLFTVAMLALTVLFAVGRGARHLVVGTPHLTAGVRSVVHEIRGPTEWSDATSAGRASHTGKNQNPERPTETSEDESEIVRDRILWFRQSHPEIGSDLRLAMARRGYLEREAERANANLQNAWDPGQTSRCPGCSGDWVSLGPTNGSGRISSIAVHPTQAGTLYAGADGGGVWKTTDGGNNWYPLTDSINNLCVGAIAISPSNPNMIYVGTGSEHSSGIGLLRSTDGGATWLFPASVVAGRFWRLSVHPGNPLELLAATDNGIFRSTDGGQTWTVPIGFSGAAQSVERDPINPLILFAAGTANGSSGGVYKSIDGGLSWVRKTTGLPVTSDVMSLAIAPSNSQVVYVCTAVGGVTHVYKSTDGGNSWSDLPGVYADPRFSVSHLLGNQAWHNNAIVVSPTNANLVIACGVFQIRSTDGGVTWNPPPLRRTPTPSCELGIHEDTTDLKFQGTTLYISGDGGMFSTPDYGETALSLNNGLVVREYYSLFNDPVVLDRVFAGSQDNGTDRRSDAFGNWTTVNVSDGFDSAVNTFQPATAFATTQNGAIFRSRRAATINSCYFEDQHIEPRLGPGESAPFFTRLVIDANNPSTLYTLSNLRIWRTFDSGDSWSPVPTTTTDGSVWLPPARVVVARSNSSVLMTSSGTDVFRSVNQGASWTKSSIGYLIMNLEIDPRDASVVYAATWGGGGVLVSSDGGNTWMARGNGLPSLPILVVRADVADPNVLYCGSYDGVYSTANQGLTWSRLGFGLPSVFIEDLRLTGDGSSLRVATYGRGVWELSLRPAAAANISGRLIDSSGNGIPNANLSLMMAGVVIASSRSDANGNYLFNRLALGRNYTVVPSKTNLTFSPGSVSYSNLTSDQTANFVATTSTYNITGRATDINGAPLSGVAIAIAGLESRTTQTNSSGEFSVLSLSPGGSFTVTPVKPNYTFSPVSRTFSNLGANQLSDFVATARSFQFSQPAYSVSESDHVVTITVNRFGDTSTSATVDYTTIDGTARQEKDYCLAAGVLTFVPGQSQASFDLIVVDNLYAEGSRTLNLVINNPTGGLLGFQSSAALTILDNDASPPGGNPLDDPDALFFVRQHYADFLNRTPDAGGLSYWAGQVTGCGSDLGCIRRRRLDVSNAFFYELEFQQTGAYVYRLYRAAFGNDQPTPNPDPGDVNEARKIPSYAAFAQDRARLTGGGNQPQQQLNLANAFVNRSEFLARYPAGLTGQGFVDVLLASINRSSDVDLSSERARLIDLFDQGGRGAVLYRLADDNLQTNPINNRAFIDAEYNRSFVYTQYAGYLRRDADIGGFLFWLGKVNEFPVRNAAIQHVMVCAFITSREYQARFSPVVTRSNSECGQ